MPAAKSSARCTTGPTGAAKPISASAHRPTPTTGTNVSYSVNNLEKYIELAGTDRIYGREILSRIDKYNEYIMTALRTDYGIRRDALSERFGFKGLLYFEYCAGKFLRNGLIVREGNVYRIPPEKLMVSNSIISDLFYIEE